MTTQETLATIGRVCTDAACVWAMLVVSRWFVRLVRAVESIRDLWRDAPDDDDGGEEDDARMARAMKGDEKPRVTLS